MELAMQITTQLSSASAVYHFPHSLVVPSATLDPSGGGTVTLE